jgi:GntR family transcriptional regulator
MPQYHNGSEVRSRSLVRDPVYQQLNDLLQGLINQGEFKAGQQFLTEREVAERFAVSRVTANKALSHLVVAGILEFRKGVGTFVREGVLDYDLQSLMSFTRKATQAGKRPQTRVLRFESVKAGDLDQHLRGALSLADSDRLYYFERLRLADGEPVILERRYLVARFCPGLTRAQLKGSLYVLLTQKYGLAITAARQTIQAVNLSPADARLLRLPAGSATLRLHAVGHAKEPLWLEDTLYRGDCYEFHNVLGTSKRQLPANLVICDSPAGQLREGTCDRPRRSASPSRRRPGWSP